MEYSRLVDGELVPLQLPDGFATAQVIGQSARAAGAPRSEGGERGDLFHARINSRSGGGAAEAEPEPAQPRVEVTVRLDVRLPALPSKSNSKAKALQVLSLGRSSAYRLFHPPHPYQGVGRGARQAAEPVSEEDRFSKIHCGC
jgi:hypothetical protein